MIQFEDGSAIVELAKNDMKLLITIMEYSYQSNIKIYKQLHEGTDIFTIGIDGTFYFHFDLEGNFYTTHMSCGNFNKDQDYAIKVGVINNSTEIKDMLKYRHNIKEVMQKFFDYYKEWHISELDKKRKWALDIILGRNKHAEKVEKSVGE